VQAARRLSLSGPSTNVGRHTQMQAKTGRKSTAQAVELRSEPLGLRIKPSMKAELQALADADRRKLAAYIEIVLEKHITEEKAKPKKK
jgi:hypothetical protein